LALSAANKVVVTLVVVCATLHRSGLQRQQRLRAIERLDRRRLIDAECRGMRPGIEVEPDDVTDFLNSSGSFDSLRACINTPERRVLLVRAKIRAT
jgi:hypothetical protein